MAGEEAKFDAAARRLGCPFTTPFRYTNFLSAAEILDSAMTGLGLIECVNLNVLSLVPGQSDRA